MDVCAAAAVEDAGKGVAKISLGGKNDQEKSKQSAAADTATSSAGPATTGAAASKQQEPAAEPAAEEDTQETEEDVAARQKVYEALAKEDTRIHMNVVFIGHVDAGKSTLGGQILCLMGGVDERTIEKYQKEAKENNRETWYMAYVMDTNDEERAKGKTVEVGRAHFNTENKRCASTPCELLSWQNHGSKTPYSSFTLRCVCTAFRCSSCTTR